MSSYWGCLLLRRLILLAHQFHLSIECNSGNQSERAMEKALNPAIDRPNLRTHRWMEK